LSAAPSDPSAPGYVRHLGSLTWHGLAQLFRAPTHSRRDDARRRLARGWLVLTACCAVAIVILMTAFDVGTISLMPPRGTASLWPVRAFTDLAKGAYVLRALGIALLAILLIAAALRGTRRALALGIGLRVAFVLLSVLLPILIGEVIKGVVGRGRPFVGGAADAFNYSHFAWTEAFASFPSGHAIVAFALAIAVPAVWPRLRIAMWIYAVLIAISRVVLLAHHPSDVVAGALLGIVGAMLVRYWFASRHLIFVIGSDGAIRPRAGPSFRRLKGVAQRRAAP
jgi:undecaprenyl-diphosphatase